jgi:hypothetical protein
MPFLRSLDQTAPDSNKEIPWPIDGLAYVIAFGGPLPGGVGAGLYTGGWLGLAVGVVVGAGITFGHAWLSDAFIDRWIARFQVPLIRPLPRVLINIVAFVWAIALCALSIVATLTILLRIDVR